MTLPVHHVAVMFFTEFGKWGEWVQHFFLKEVTDGTQKFVEMCRT
jgi:hypothetical protein